MPRHYRHLNMNMDNPTQQQIEAWDAAIAAIDALRQAAIDARTTSATPAAPESCDRLTEQAQAVCRQLGSASRWARTRCSPDRCDLRGPLVRCDTCLFWFCADCCCAEAGACADCALPPAGGGDSGSKKRGADEVADPPGAAKKLKPTASEDDEIIPDLDDPSVPAWVWDWLLRDGKITKDDRLRAAQHADKDDDCNLCVKCGVDMGADNPRQYCGKNVCLGLGFE